MGLLNKWLNNDDDDFANNITGDEYYDLKPEECFFLDDKPENIRTSLEVGMDGIVFTGDIEAVKRMIEF